MRICSLLLLLVVAPASHVPAADAARTHVNLRDGRWFINDRVTNPGSAAEGLLMNTRMVNATFEDRIKPEFDPGATTGRFISRIADYAAHGVNAFTLCLQGGMPGYEGAVNSAFLPNGSLLDEYMKRIERVIRACDKHGLAVILGLFYQRQSAILKDDDAVRAGVVNAVRWVGARGFRNVLIEIANEYPHKGFAHALIRDPKGQASLIRLAKQTAPGLMVTASGYGDGKVHAEVAEACDFLAPHWNGTRVEDIPARIAALKRFGKPIVCNEDDRTGAKSVAALHACVESGAGYGLLLQKHNQHFPFHFDGAADDPIYYAALKAATSRRQAGAPPYPPSPVIERVEFDFSTHERLAPGSDNWPTTWADDGNIYAAWGDGGGLEGSNSKGRVSLGVARIEGGAENYAGHNVWGGFGAEHPAQFEGKSYGLLSVGGVLYMWVSNQPKPHLGQCQLASSMDHGATWQIADWSFRFGDQLTVPTFLNFGRDHAGARDGYVYCYFIHPTWGPGESATGNYGFDVHKPGRVHLARVPKEAILERSRYEFFAGLAGKGAPKWSANLSDKQPVFEDANGVGWNLSVSFNPGLRRYLLATEHSETHAGRLGLFDAPEPWGPWTTVAYEDKWGAGHIEVSTFYWNFPAKWLSTDGTRFTLVFTGKKSNDLWNSVDGRFICRAADYFPPPDAEGGWRTRPNDARFDAAFEFAKHTTRHGGLLVLHRGALLRNRQARHAQTCPRRPA